MPAALIIGKVLLLTFFLMGYIQGRGHGYQNGLKHAQRQVPQIERVL